VIAAQSKDKFKLINPIMIIDHREILISQKIPTCLVINSEIITPKEANASNLSRNVKSLFQQMELNIHK